MMLVSDTNKWLFDGIGTAIVVAIAGYALNQFLKRRSAPEDASLVAQGAKVTNSPVASGTGITQNINSPNIHLSLPGIANGTESDGDFWLAFDPRGSRPLNIQNSGSEPAFDVVVKIPANGNGFASDVINRLDNDRSWQLCTLKGNFVHLETLRTTIVEEILRGPGTNQEEVKEIPVLITYRTRAQQNCEFHLEIRLPLRNGIQFSLPKTPKEHSLDEKILKFMEEGPISEPVPFTGAGNSILWSRQIANAISAPIDVVTDRLERLELRGRVQRHEGNLSDSAPRWSIVQR